MTTVLARTESRKAFYKTRLKHGCRVCLARRRDEGTAVTPAMRATAVYLGLVLKMNFEGVGARQWPAESGEEAASGAGGAAGPSSTFPGQVGACDCVSCCMHLTPSCILDALAVACLQNMPACFFMCSTEADTTHMRSSGNLGRAGKRET